MGTSLVSCFFETQCRMMFTFLANLLTYFIVFCRMLQNYEINYDTIRSLISYKCSIGLSHSQTSMSYELFGSQPSLSSCSGARLTKSFTTMLRLFYDIAKVTSTYEGRLMYETSYDYRTISLR